MAEKSIMVSLGDSRIKAIADVITNKTCSVILDSLAEKQATVTELSSSLHIPLNTVDYNIKKLVKAGLIEKAESFWSVKGKKMPSYKVSEKSIIISPKKFTSKAFVIAGSLTLLLSVGLRSLMNAQIPLPLEQTSDTASLMMAAKAAPEFSLASAPMLRESFLSTVPSWGWFLIGAGVLFGLYFLISLIIERRNN